MPETRQPPGPADIAQRRKDGRLVVHIRRMTDREMRDAARPFETKHPRADTADRERDAINKGPAIWAVEDAAGRWRLRKAAPRKEQPDEKKEEPGFHLFYQVSLKL
jgi:hypothetical protein